MTGLSKNKVAEPAARHAGRWHVRRASARASGQASGRSGGSLGLTVTISLELFTGVIDFLEISRVFSFMLDLNTE